MYRIVNIGIARSSQQTLDSSVLLGDGMPYLCLILGTSGSEVGIDVLEVSVIMGLSTA